jgi:hypothetical protein
MEVNVTPPKPPLKLREGKGESDEIDLLPINS